MQSVGFVDNAAQTPASLHVLLLLMSVLPASMCVVSLVLVLCYPLNEGRMAQIASDLRVRRARDADRQA
jgi:GPH family glycoside/pentoside/hexuronide:cation symporter